MLPNTLGRMFVWRPILAEPPIYSLADVSRLTLGEIADANEILDFREELARRAQERAR